MNAVATMIWRARARCSKRWYHCGPSSRRVRRTIPGDIAGIELERKGGNWLYEIKVISPKGVMIEVHIDARTGAILPDKDE